MYYGAEKITLSSTKYTYLMLTSNYIPNSITYNYYANNKATDSQPQVNANPQNDCSNHQNNLYYR